MEDDLYGEQQGDIRIQAAAPLSSAGSFIFALCCGCGLAPLAVATLGITVGLADWAQHWEGAAPAVARCCPTKLCTF